MVISFAVLLLNVVAMPYLLAAAIPIIALFLFIRHYYLKTSREIKRLEAMSEFQPSSHTLKSSTSVFTQGHGVFTDRCIFRLVFGKISCAVHIIDSSILRELLDYAGLLIGYSGSCVSLKGALCVNAPLNKCIDALRSSLLPSDTLRL